jgi:hypothetical protein
VFVANGRLWTSKKELKVVPVRDGNGTAAGIADEGVDL